MGFSLNSSSGLDTYVYAAIKPNPDQPGQLYEISSQAYFKPGVFNFNPDRSMTVFSDYTENLFTFTQFDLQNDGVIIGVDWTPGPHTTQYGGGLIDYRLISIRDQAGATGNTVEMVSNSTNGYTNDFFVSRSSTTVKDTNVGTSSQTRQRSYIHYKPGTRVFSLVNDGTEEDTYTLPAGAFNIDRVLVGGGRPDDRIFGWVMLRKTSSDFSAAEVTEFEDRFQYLFVSDKKYYRRFRL